MSTFRKEAFFASVSAGDRDRVAELVDEDPTLLETRDAEGRTGLLLAVYHGQHEVVNLLTDRRPGTDVFEAAASGQAGRIRDLLRGDPDRLRAVSSDGFSPLGLAAFFGNPEVVEILLASGADPNQASRNTMRVTPLHSGAAHGDPDVALRVCRLLLEAGADPDAPQAGGWRPLHQAASHGNLPLVQLLIRHGAGLAPMSDDDRTPLAMAREGGHDSVVRFLEDASSRE